MPGNFGKERIYDTWVHWIYVRKRKVASVYIGNNVAIPHGVSGSEKNILKSGISFVQVPDGVPFDNGEIAYLIIGIAGKGDEHMGYLEQIAFVCSEEENIIKLKNSVNKEEILKIFEEVSIWCRQYILEPEI